MAWCGVREGAGPNEERRGGRREWRKGGEVWSSVRERRGEEREDGVWCGVRGLDMERRERAGRKREGERERDTKRKINGNRG